MNVKPIISYLEVDNKSCKVMWVTLMYIAFVSLNVSASSFRKYKSSFSLNNVNIMALSIFAIVNAVLLLFRMVLRPPLTQPGPTA